MFMRKTATAVIAAAYTVQKGTWKFLELVTKGTSVAFTAALMMPVWPQIATGLIYAAVNGRAVEVWTCITALASSHRKEAADLALWFYSLAAMHLF